MAQTQVTEEAMMQAGMSLIGMGVMPSDLNVFAAANSKEHFKATGHEVEALQLSSGVSDIARELVMIEEVREKDEKRNDLVEFLSDQILEDQEAFLEKLRTEQITYANGQFNIGGKWIDEEDMEAAIDDALENFDHFAAQHNLDEQQATALYAAMVAFQNETDPVKRAEILNEMKEISVEATADIAEKAENIRLENKSELSAQEEIGPSVAQTTDVAAWEEQTTLAAENTQNVGKLAEMRMDIDVGGANPFADIVAASDEFNAAAQGTAQMTELNQTQDITPAAPSPMMG